MQVFRAGCMCTVTLQRLHPPLAMQARNNRAAVGQTYVAEPGKPHLYAAQSLV